MRRPGWWTWTLLMLPIVMILGATVPWTRPGPAPASAATDCDPARSHDAGDFDLAIESGGQTRPYILHVAPSYTGEEATPLVLNLHGHSDDGPRQAAYSELPDTADAAGFILVSPHGTETTRDPGRHWNFTTLEGLVDTQAADDVAFIAQLLDSLEAELCIDSARVFATGLSNGAFMTVRLACNLSDRIAATAPVAGVYFPPWSPDLAIEPGCLSARPVPVIAFHGTADDRVPFEGGPFPPGLLFRIRHIEAEVMPDWAAHNGCDSVPTEEQLTEHVRLVRYENCDQGAIAELYVVEGGGHTWPGATEDRGLGVTTQEINANDLMWDFFVAHPLVAAAAEATATAPPQAAPSATGLPALPATGAGGTSDGASTTGWLSATLAGALALGIAAWYTRRRKAW